jgi:hypothetical protein
MLFQGSQLNLDRDVFCTSLEQIADEDLPVNIGAGLKNVQLLNVI